MHSRADTVRIHVERGLRLLALLILAYAAWIASRPAADTPERATTADLRASLPRWTVAAPSRVHVELDAPPHNEERAWLRALRRAGTAVSWSGDELQPLALEVVPAVDPLGGTLIWLAAPPGARVALSDEIALIDSVVASGGGGTVLAPATSGRLTAAIGSQRAVASVRDSIALRRVLVMGGVSWEAKFVISALEEAGWPVDARLTLAPGIAVSQGRPGTPDTTRHAAVIVLGAVTPGDAAGVARYVRSGGGAVLAGSMNTGTLASLAAGRMGARVRPASLTFADDAPRRALGFLAILPRIDAVTLEERDGRVAVAARRVESGRVVQIGYDETWRWRLGGGARALDAHRAWWTALVSAAAYRAVVEVPRRRDDDAPVARLVHSLGTPTSAERVTGDDAPWTPPPTLLFALVSALVMAEIASRRLRGAA